MPESPISVDALVKQVIETEEIKSVLEEFAGNMGFKVQGLPEYGLHKIVRYSTVVAYAAMLRLPLDLFRMTPEDIHEHQARLLQAAKDAGIPTFVVDESGLREEREG